MSIDDQIESKVKRSRQGDILFVEDFLDTGTSGAVHISLHRLVKAGKIVRLARAYMPSQNTANWLEKYYLLKKKLPRQSPKEIKHAYCQQAPMPYTY